MEGRIREKQVGPYSLSADIIDAVSTYFSSARREVISNIESDKDLEGGLEHLKLSLQAMRITSHRPFNIAHKSIDEVLAYCSKPKMDPRVLRQSLDELDAEIIYA